MASVGATKHIILTGPPGVGKTTLIHKACEALKEKQVPIQGFYTEEIRAGGRRTGFDVVTLNGARGPLARVAENDGMQPSRREYRVGQYKVELQAFEQTALPVLKNRTPDTSQVYIIDEIGKMEMFSNSFKDAVNTLFKQPKNVVVCTIPIQKGKPIHFVEEVRARKDATLFMISRENRNDILEDIVKSILASYNDS